MQHRKVGSADLLSHAPRPDDEHGDLGRVARRALLGPNDNDIYEMYKYVIPYQQLYGRATTAFSGTNWDDPPILKNPSDTRTINGREYLLFYEQDKLRLVGWQTSKGSYWVINTLSHALTEAQMLELAASTRELGG